MLTALSPLAQHTIAALNLSDQYRDKVSEKRKTRRIEEVTRYVCPECGDLHEWEDDARDCCAAVGSSDADNEACFCPVCRTEHYDAFSAADCCLWKDLDHPTRYAMAERVEAGSDWKTELGL